jgi:hypothetical protein
MTARLALEIHGPAFPPGDRYLAQSSAQPEEAQHFSGGDEEKGQQKIGQ